MSIRVYAASYRPPSLSVLHLGHVSGHLGWVVKVEGFLVLLVSCFVPTCTNISHAPGVGHFGGRKYKGCCLGIAVCLLCQQHQLHI